MDTLINKTYKEYKYFSRYSNVPYYYNTIDNKYMYGTSTPINKNITHILHKVKNGDTLDSLALEYYNTPLYFWVIAWFNDIDDVFESIQDYKTLKIPTLSEISFKQN